MRQIMNPLLLKTGTYLAFGMMLCGILLFYNAENEIALGWKRNQWPVVTGTVVESRITGRRAFRPEIIYQYRLETKIYTDSTDLHTPGFGNRRYRLVTAERITGMFPAGSPVRIYYDPSDPAVSLLYPGPYWSDFLQLALSIIFLLSGGIVIGRAFLKRQHSGPPPTSQIHIHNRKSRR
jgi:hypothetical protein